ncbi:helix-turn-helix domain-containing protein [Haloarchaeobius sp. HRN-SO-5]|uniref:helix-turn-helix domain-containing protein n=1 Tax=Haloarchaeobius sp. HRN-SO-5 TaxID=3446118 RepID=UPI003EB99E6C
MREAVIQVPQTEFEKLGLEGFVSHIRAAGLRDLSELVCYGDGCLFVVTVESEIGDDLAQVDRLEWYEQLSGATEKVVYLCKVVPDVDGEVRPMRTLGISSRDIQVGEGGVEVTLVGEQDDIAQGVDAYDDAGMSVVLQRISDYTGPTTALDTLTDRQLEILETAFGLGYFDVPRNVSTEEVAEELDLDPSTVAEHLRRAERNLLSELLASA